MMHHNLVSMPTEMDGGFVNFASTDSQDLLFLSSCQRCLDLREARRQVRSRALQGSSKALLCRGSLGSCGAPREHHVLLELREAHMLTDRHCHLGNVQSIVCSRLGLGLRRLYDSCRALEKRCHISQLPA